MRLRVCLGGGGGGAWEGAGRGWRWACGGLVPLPGFARAYYTCAIFPARPWAQSPTRRPGRWVEKVYRYNKYNRPSPFYQRLPHPPRQALMYLMYRRRCQRSHSDNPRNLHLLPDHTCLHCDRPYPICRRFDTRRFDQNPPNMSSRQQDFLPNNGTGFPSRSLPKMREFATSRKTKGAERCFALPTLPTAAHVWNFWAGEGNRSHPCAVI